MGQQFAILTRSFEKLVGTDISTTALKLAQEHSQVRCLACANASEQPFAAGIFDFALCSEVIEHIRPKESEQAFQSIYSVLSPGGYLLVTTPNAWELGRMSYELPIKLLSRLLSVDRFALKARMYNLFLRLSGKRSSYEREH